MECERESPVLADWVNSQPSPKPATGKIPSIFKGRLRKMWSTGAPGQLRSLATLLQTGPSWAVLACLFDHSVGARLLKPVKRAVHTAPALVHYVRVDHRGLHARMSEQLLHRADVVAVFQQMRGE